MRPEVQEFLESVLPAQVAAEREVHNGRVEDRLAMWSKNDPVSVFGVWRMNQGWDGVSDAITTVATRFTNCTHYDFEVEVCDVIGDMAYTAGYEPTSCSVDGAPSTYTLRVTNIYRREKGEWKLVHRHADRRSDEQTSA